MGEAELDGDPALLLLLEPVGVDAGQRPDERGLAVVDVAGGADDQVAHAFRSSRAASSTAAARGAISPSSTVRRSSSRRPSCSLPITARGARRSAASSRCAGWPGPPSASADGGEGLGGERAAPDLAGRRDDQRPPGRAGLGRSRRRAPAGAPPDRLDGRGDHAQRGNPRAALLAVQVQPQRGLQGGEGELVDAHRAVQRVLPDEFDQVLAADDQPRLRGAEELVAAEGDQRGARRDRVRTVGSPGSP